MLVAIEMSNKTLWKYFWCCKKSVCRFIFSLIFWFNLDSFLPVGQGSKLGIFWKTLDSSQKKKKKRNRVDAGIVSGKKQELKAKYFGVKC